jgi:hypothetical protein
MAAHRPCADQVRRQAGQSRELHEAEVKILGRGFADMKSTDEMVASLAGIRMQN